MNQIVSITSKKKIGDGHPSFVIAEAGSNHNGSLRRAVKLIDIVADAGADAVKFQTFKADKLYVKTAGQSRYLKLNESIYGVIKEMEMPRTWIPKLARYCEKKKIIFLSSPFDQEAVDLLDPYVPAFKIASYEMTDHPLVEYIAKKGKPLLMSTGTADLKEVSEAVEVIRRAGNQNLILMQCTAKYPAPLDSLNLKTIITMKEKFQLPVGLSDHSQEWNIAPLAAVALGANCLEKHFTISRRFKGPDHRFSIEPKELRNMVQMIRLIEQTLGDGIKKTLKVEKELHRFARRSIFAIKDLRPGEKFTSENVSILRCGNQKGYLHPRDYSKLLKSIATRKIRANMPIKYSYFAS